MFSSFLDPSLGVKLGFLSFACVGALAYIVLGKVRRGKQDPGLVHFSSGLLDLEWTSNMIPLLQTFPALGCTFFTLQLFTPVGKGSTA